MSAFTFVSEAFSKGGLWMWFILAMQIVALAIIVERVIALYFKRRADQRSLVGEFEEPIRKGELETVAKRAGELATEQPIGRTLFAGVQAAKNWGGKEEIQGKMDEVLMAENENIEKRTGFLAVIANVATLAGLLGTITGMIKSFAAVSSANPMEKATLLSNGISEAMNTTAYGLIVAIPTLLCYALLVNRGTALSEDLNQSALKAFNWLSFSFEPVAARKKSVLNQERAPEANA